EKKLVNPTVESAIDRIKEIVSLANAARNTAGLKRRWPIKEVIICGYNLNGIYIEGVSDMLKSQLNAAQYRMVEIAAGSQLEKVASLLDSDMPISVAVLLDRKNIAPRVKADIGDVMRAFESSDKLDMIRSFRKSGRYLLEYNDKTVELSPSDVQLAYKTLEGYSSSERDNPILFISRTREKDLITKGLIRDLARQLQQLRKERQYNPTDTIDAAYVAGLEAEEISSLSFMKDELTYLVRVKAVQLSKEPLINVAYKAVEIDGREFKISVE
ncbi:MAG TPA: DUF5915 domain-containing protein, partial [Nitrososphaeraceae archaeon]|nr:DUF5915 domain-containing protein [Nitrososphaeraceae archaeon]